MFKRKQCPICSNKTIFNHTTCIYSCHSVDHKYLADDLDFTIIFKNFVITCLPNETQGYLKDSNYRYYRINNRAVSISCDLLAQLKTEENILDYIKNLELIS